MPKLSPFTMMPDACCFTMLTGLVEMLLIAWLHDCTTVPLLTPDVAVNAAPIGVHAHYPRRHSTMVFNHFLTYSLAYP